MSSFEIRLPTARRGPWPVKPPDARAVAGSGRLWVPLTGDVRGVVNARPAGTRVAAGEPLVESSPEASHVPVAPVGGELGAVREVTLVGGAVVRAVELRADDAAAGEPGPGAARVELPAEPTREQLPLLIDLLRRAGVHARRHASPDLVEQLLLILRRPVDTVLCNLLDGDPPARPQAATAARWGRQVVDAVATLRAWTGASSATVVHDEATPGRWLAELRGGAKGAGVRLVGLDNDYPQADPSLLIHRLSGRRLRPGRSPVEQGVLMLDALAAVAVARAVRDGTPMTHSAVTIFDHFVRGDRSTDQLHDLEVPIGTPVGEIVTSLRLDRRQTTMRCGELLRDVPVDADAVVGGGEVVLHLLPRTAVPAVDPCIRCGWCVQGCPTRIHPAGLLEAAQHADLRLAEHYGLEACIECGICSYVCPSNLPLLQGIRQLRARTKHRDSGA